MSDRQRTLLKINLKSLAHNLACYRKALAPNTRMMAMVKADAYGSGAIEISKCLISEGIDYLGVAFIDEGIQLRKAGIQVPIQVFLPDLSMIALATTHQLELSINSIDALETLLTADPNNHLPSGIHINLDTGMHRLGINEREVDHLIYLIKGARPQIQIISLFSHLASAGSSINDHYTRMQLQRFSTCTQTIINQLKINPWRHILNSDGIERHTDHQYDLVRLGIGLYGVHTRPIKGQKLKPVHRLETQIIAIRQLNSGQSVGYSRMWKAKSPASIATIPVGYADGIMRQSGQRQVHVLVKDTMVPIIGLVSMDSCTIDVTQISDIHVGQQVIIFGPDAPLSQFAHKNNTISYEILSRISKRIKRLYI